ncbi:MAG: phage tail protein [Rhodocyclaceae bacterium]|nr:phage tail protein [Rhodocyclaceae bacterium]MCP5234802.1 phage tail protein [Zoogloeaceae bacterium]
MAETFTWQASYGSALDEAPRVEAISFGDGYEARVGQGINQDPRRWSLVFTNKPTPVADALVSFLRARGALESFDWTDPEDNPGRWVCRAWNSQPTSPRHRTITCEFHEVFELV